MFQMMVATHHDIKTRGVEWLIEQGVREILLVAVAMPNTSLDFAIPNTLTSHIMQTYQLAMKSLEI
jgi:hypothetical protein